MNQNLREPTTHGTLEYPFTIYHMKNFHHPFYVSLHWHDEVEMIYIEQGTLFLTIDQNSFTGTAGDLFMVNRQEIHKMHVEDRSTSYYTILFPLSSLKFLSMDHANHEYLVPLAEGQIRFCNKLTDCSAYPVLLSDIRQLIHIYYEKDTAYQLGTKAILLHMIYEFYVGNCILNAPQELRYHHIHREILKYINENYQNEISLTMIAQNFHMSEKYFSRYFKNTFHTTMTDYINHVRLEHALELLQNTDLSITDIALQSGFNSCSYFNKKFKAAFGKAPTAYRGG